MNDEHKTDALRRLKNTTADELLRALGFEPTDAPICRTVLVSAITQLSPEAQADIIQFLEPLHRRYASSGLETGRTRSDVPNVSNPPREVGQVSSPEPNRQSLPRDAERAWDDGRKSGYNDGWADALGNTRRIGDKNPYRSPT